jgi:hypothetical protein
MFTTACAWAETAIPATDATPARIAIAVFIEFMVHDSLWLIFIDVACSDPASA